MIKKIVVIIMVLVCAGLLYAASKPSFPILYFRFAENMIPDMSDSQIADLNSLAAQVSSGQVTLESVPALNAYNFSELSNKLLGNLYKSHGCLHISPRNAYLMYELLPIGSKLTIYPYEKKVDQALFDHLPFLADLIDFEADIKKLKQATVNNKKIASQIEFAVYPQSGAWIGYVNKKPVVKLMVEAGPKYKLYIMQERNAHGSPVFQPNMAYPTKSGTYYIFKKVVNYYSNFYRDLTIVPQGAPIKRSGDAWTYLNEGGKWAKLPQDIIDDLALPADKRLYDYYVVSYDSKGRPDGARWGGNTFGKFAIILSKDKRTMDPQLVHTSGDLMMEERSVMGDVISMLLATPEALDDCIPSSENFDLYKTCADFVNDPNRDDLIEPVQSGNYKVFFDLPLDPAEAAVVPKDVLIAYKSVIKQQPLTGDEKTLLLKEGLAKKVNGQIAVNKEKLYGVIYDASQYVVAVKKNAHHYLALKDNWESLKPIMKALLADYQKFPPNNRELYLQVISELIIERTLLHELTQDRTADIIEQFANM